MELNKIERAKECLIDNGVDKEEVDTVLEALAYILLDQEIFKDPNRCGSIHSNDKLRYEKIDDTEKWYDVNDNLIHFKNSDGYEEWKDYDENGTLIYLKDSEGNEQFFNRNGELDTEKY